MKQRSSLLSVVVISTILLVLHQDYWLWTNESLVFGFLPLGLFWHLCISLAAVVCWAVVSHFYWPFESDQFASNLNEEHAVHSETEVSNKESRS